MERRYRKGWRPPLAAGDARSLVPVIDEVGGIVLYLNGDPTYYVLNGEWFPALPPPAADAGAPPVAPVVPVVPVVDDELVGPPVPWRPPSPV